MVDVVIEDDRWASLDLESLAEVAVDAALKISNATNGYEVCVMGCSDARISELNGDFRDKPQATNVLSWPALEILPENAGNIPSAGPDDSLGDIAIAFETCTREASEKGIPVRDHVTHLVIHGTLHLLGYDHETDHDAEIMEGLEIKALASMGLKTPY
ncbi:MAG: rRNA maturation RNase YbeY [Alphaproteobacteria bacterium]